MITLRLGTRGSPLALAQSRQIASLLESSRPGVTVTPVIIRTAGDRDQNSALSRMGGKGVFVKEIEEQLLSGGIDLAVHSLKDLPALLPDGLALAAFPRRAEHRDLLVTRDGSGLEDLPDGARVATGSLRRRAQLAAHRPDLRFVDLRGNVDTRLRRLDEGLANALVLAAAGVERLGLREKVGGELLDEETCLPSAGQGIIGVETREEDAELREIVSGIGDRSATVEACAERGFLAELSGSCLIPAAGLARFDGTRVRMSARILTTDGLRCAKASTEGAAADAWEVGAEAGRLCLDRGGAEILAELSGGAGEP